MRVRTSMTQKPPFAVVFIGLYWSPMVDQIPTINDNSAGDDFQWVSNAFVVVFIGRQLVDQIPTINDHSTGVTFFV